MGLPDFLVGEFFRVGGHFLPLREHLHPLVRQGLADAVRFGWKVQPIYLRQLQLMVTTDFSVADQPHCQFQVAVGQLLVEQEDLGTVALAGVLVLQLLQSGRTTSEALIVEGKTELHLRIGEDTRLTLLRVKHVDFHLFNRKTFTSWLPLPAALHFGSERSEGFPHFALR